MILDQLQTQVFFSLVLDTWGNGPAGLFNQIHIDDYGQFDLCLSYTFRDRNKKLHPTQHVLLGVSTNRREFRLGVCLPATCSIEDVHLLMELVVPKMRLRFYEVSRMTEIAQPNCCTEIIVTVLLVAVVLVVLYATRCAISGIGTKFLNFSLTITYPLVTQPRHKTRFAFLDGLKIISWAQIVVFNVFRYGYPQELEKSDSHRHLSSFQTIVYGGVFAADSFFLISGLLLSYKFMENRQKG